WAAWLLLGGLAFAGLPAWRDILRRLRSTAPFVAEGRAEKLLAGYVVLTVLPAFLLALTPPIAWDSQVYHLTGPRLYIERGAITGGIDIPYLGFPALVDTLFGAAMLLRGPAVAKLIHFGYAVLSLLLLYAAGSRYFTRRAAWLAMAILVAAPTITLLASWAYVDLAVLFYELAAVYLVARGLEREAGARTRLLALAGACCGLAVGVKYTALLLPAALAGAILWYGRREGWRRALRQATVFGAVAGLGASPWFLRNWALTGNPIYPFFLSGQFWDEYRAWFYSRAGTGLAFSAPWRLLIAPWEATVLGQEGAEGYAATIGPLLLLAVPLLLLTWRRWTREQKGFAGLLLVACVPQYLFWLYGVAQSALLIQTRLLFPIFGLLALLAGFALDRLSLLDRPSFSLHRLFSGVMAIVLGLDLLASALHFANGNPLRYLVGYESAGDLLDRYQYDYQQAIDYINQELPPEAKIYFLWEPRSFYCQRNARPDAILDAFLHLRYRFGAAEDIARYLRTEGYTHVLLHERGMRAIVQAGFDPVTAKDLAVMDELRTRYWSPVAEWGDAYRLYEVRP
ncbi:MAG TPA: glycosyltransferase family 39 protein, partial [Anaerolineae bacterium]|nr:glycosyltransferase family 39 protein [Anaerolineae bacterium]